MAVEVIESSEMLGGDRSRDVVIAHFHHSRTAVTLVSQPLLYVHEIALHQVLHCPSSFDAMHHE